MSSEFGTKKDSIDKIHDELGLQHFGETKFDLRKIPKLLGFSQIKFNKFNLEKIFFFNIKTLLFWNLPPSSSSLRSVVENTIKVRYLRGKAHRYISCNHLIVKKKHLSKTLLICTLNNLPLSHTSGIISQKMTGNKA